MKVKFEIDIAKVVNNPLSTKDEWVLDENNKFRAVLIEDPMGAHQIQFVNSYYGEGEGKYASLQYFPLPLGTKIFTDDDKEPLSNEGLFDHIEDCYDKLSSEIDKLSSKVEAVREVQIPNLSEAASVIIKHLEEAKENPSSSGISEKTLLEALKIVSNNSNTKQQ